MPIQYRRGERPRRRRLPHAPVDPALRWPTMTKGEHTRLSPSDVLDPLLVNRVAANRPIAPGLFRAAVTLVDTCLPSS